MTIPELLNKLKAAGVQVVLTPEGPRLRGKPASDELKAAVKSRREEVLAYLEDARLVAMDRYQKAPAEHLPLHLAWAVPSELGHRAGLFEYVIRQGGEAQRWAVKRADAYRAAGVTDHLEAEWRGALDLLCWQRSGAEPATALAWLDGIEEAYRDSKKHEPVQ